MKPTPTTPPNSAKAGVAPAKCTACYFVMPNLAKDVWYGFPERPESAQLVCFVEQRHSYIKPDFDATYLAEALNEKADASSRLTAENEALRAALKHIRIIATFSDSNAELNRDRLKSIQQDANAALAQPAR